MNSKRKSRRKTLRNKRIQNGKGWFTRSKKIHPYTESKHTKAHKEKHRQFYSISSILKNAKSGQLSQGRDHRKPKIEKYEYAEDKSFIPDADKWRIKK